ncbi:hypothetical protein LCGC14_2971690, partial [marine sediment metagenome]
GDEPASTQTGQITALADKIDTITGCFLLGLIPTGSADPYSLRRQAAGIIGILSQTSWQIGILELVTLAIDTYTRANISSKDAADIAAKLQDFIVARLKRSLSDIGEPDTIEAVLAAGFDNVGEIIKRVRLIEESKGKKELEDIKVDPNQKIITKKVDVSKYVDVEKACLEVIAELGHVDILVNNAGITKDALLMKMSEEDFDRVIDINLKSVYNTCKVLIRPMMKNSKSKIINISSIVGLIGNFGQTNYAASKAGMIGFTKSLAKEVASRNINVNAVAPGFIETEMTEKIPEKVKELMLKNIPLKRFGKPQDIANMVLFLASDDSDYITGQVFTVDGGMVM